MCDALPLLLSHVMECLLVYFLVYAFNSNKLYLMKDLVFSDCVEGFRLNQLKQYFIYLVKQVFLNSF